MNKWHFDSADRQSQAYRMGFYCEGNKDRLVAPVEVVRGLELKEDDNEKRIEAPFPQSINYRAMHFQIRVEREHYVPKEIDNVRVHVSGVVEGVVVAKEVG